MYGALLATVFFLPYSFALIEIFQVTMIVAWGFKFFLLRKTPVQRTSQGLNFISPGMVWSLTAVALLIVLTIPFSHYPAVSLKKFVTRFLQQIFLMYLVTEIVYDRKRLYGVLSMLLLTFFIVSVDIMIQCMGGKDIFHHTALIYGRVTGPMNHPNDLGTLLVTVLPVVLVLTVTSRIWIPLLCKSFNPLWMGRVVISLLFLLLVVALGLTSSRGAWVAFAISMVTLGVYLKNYKLVIGMVLALGLFLGMFGMHCLNTRHDIYNFPIKQGSLIINQPSASNALGLLFDPNGRESYWSTSVDVIRHYPWFGCGYSAYTQTLKDMHAVHEDYPHNSLLHITAELGFAGLILYGWFFTAFWVQVKNVLDAISRERDLFLLGCGISAGILAWILHSLVDTAWASLQLGVLCWLFMGLLLSLKLLVSNNKGEPLCP